MGGGLLGPLVKCQRCPAQVVWVKTEARHKSMPLDPEPSPSGNVILVPVPQSRHVVARVLPAGQEPAEGEPAYLSHFVTCRAGRPRAGQVRRTSDCQLCSWSIEGKTVKAVRAAFDAHYAAEHLDRCRTCNVPVKWIRAEQDMAILMLDPEPVDDGDFVIVAGRDQALARKVDRESLLDTVQAYRQHPCPVQGATR